MHDDGAYGFPLSFRADTILYAKKAFGFDQHRRALRGILTGNGRGWRKSEIASKSWPWLKQMDSALIFKTLVFGTLQQPLGRQDQASGAWTAAVYAAFWSWSGRSRTQRRGRVDLLRESGAASTLGRNSVACKCDVRRRMVCWPARSVDAWAESGLDVAACYFLRPR